MTKSPHSVDEPMMSEGSLQLIEERLHALMRTRVRELFGDLPISFPRLDQMEDGEPHWLPVAGMYGGFKYWLEGTRQAPQLQVESWSRVIGYSGTAHVITATATTLVRSGFG